MISPVINWYFKQRNQDLRENLEKANQKQEELFVDLIERLSNTRYGEKYGISKKKNKLPRFLQANACGCL